MTRIQGRSINQKIQKTRLFRRSETEEGPDVVLEDSTVPGAAHKHLIADYWRRAQSESYLRAFNPPNRALLEAAKSVRRPRRAPSAKTRAFRQLDEVARTVLNHRRRVAHWSVKWRDHTTPFRGAFHSWVTSPAPVEEEYHRNQFFWIGWHLVVEKQYWFARSNIWSRREAESWRIHRRRLLDALPSTPQRTVELICSVWLSLGILRLWDRISVLYHNQLYLY